ncbi:putative sugar transporter [Durotheca rogersii]|uniref:putative sugar transporter n=1 Tax=Durotheca rogersii TaxID=419775 RepID=UPI00221EA49C|nr:putative sugar transporter [Durotheca rogersii]KAI5857426.1 putative sugar transporter [Durotheca rogersii]
MIRKQSRIYGGRLIATITLVDAISSCWFGYCQGVFAGVLVSDDFKQSFPQTLDPNVSGITASCFFFGAFAGSLVAFVLGDKLGRKRTIALGLMCSFVGVILQFLAWHMPQMILGRLVNGIGIGLTSTMTPVYLSECAKPHQRGKLVGIGASANVTTFSLANWISYALYFRDGPLQWRFPLAFQLIFPFLVTPLLFCVPETPRWLLLVGREEQALEVLSLLAGKDIPIDDSTVVSEFRSIKSAIELEREDRTPLWDVLCFRDKTHNFRRLILSCGTQFMQQFSGINALGFYLPTLLNENVGFNQEMSRLIAAINGTIYFVSAFGSLVIIDRFGRRKMMLSGTTAMGACHLIASLCLRQGEIDASQRKMMGNVATAMFIVYHVFFGTCWASTPWVYSAEINSLGWRTRGAAAATAMNWMGGFAVTQFTKVGIDNLQWAFFLIVFAVMSFFFFPVVLLFYPETSNRTLEDMDHMFIQNPSVFVFGKAEMTQRQRPMSFIDAESERIGSA